MGLVELGAGRAGPQDVSAVPGVLIRWRLMARSAAAARLHGSGISGRTAVLGLGGSRWHDTLKQTQDYGTG